MLFSVEQLICHAVGDYVLQSDWMASEKTHRWLPALAHACVYSSVFLLLTRSPLVLLTIGTSHLLIDRYRIARYLCFAKNHLSPSSTWKPWRDSQATGFPSDTPVWLTVWLLIINDNRGHVTINALALKFL